MDRLYLTASLWAWVWVPLGMPAPAQAQEERQQDQQGQQESQTESQQIVSREVVQSLPPVEVQQLNDALQRLAHNSRDLAALSDAGNAALELGDIDAAMGFFGRAQDISPDNPDVTIGMARVLVRSGRPFEAIRLLSEAEIAGASAQAVEGERGLAYDLIGQTALAQDSYRAALRMGADDDDEVIRRLALSQAISGDRKGFEKTLAPLLARRDLTSLRAQALGLAILGKTKEASKIARSVMPQELAAQLMPYLGHMSKLTQSQQAAAANLGIFPKASAIGRDPPQLAQYTGSSRQAGSSGQDIRPEPGDRAAGSEAPGDRAPGDKAAPRAASDSSRPLPDRADTGEVAQARIAQRVVPSPDGAPARASADKGLVAASPPAAALDDRPASPSPASPAPSAAPVSLLPQRANVANAFADFAAKGRTVETAPGAVNLRAIDIPYEKKEEPEEAQAAPSKPEHPERYWVQIATGRDRAALKYDWRRLARKAPRHLADLSPHVARWNKTNRLLAGPLPSSKQASALAKALREEGIDGFAYTSPEGQKIYKIQ